MHLTTGNICEMLGGELIGMPDISITNLARIEDGQANSLTFLHNPKYLPYFYETQAGAILVNRNFSPEKKTSAALIKVDNAYEAFIKLLNFFSQSLQKEKLGVEKEAYVHPTAKLGEKTYVGSFSYLSENVVIGSNVHIYPNVYVGANVQIDNNTVIFPNAVIYDNCVIGKNCIIQAGSIIGSDGFGFLQDTDNLNVKIPQLGNVILEDNVEIGANVCIDRAMLGSTIIKKGVKLDNLIQIGHNVEIGENSVFAAQTGVSGSVRIGKNCMFGGQTGLVGHIIIADGVKLGAKSGVSKSLLTPNQVLRGQPAQELKSQLKTEALQRNLPDLLARIEALEKKLNDIQPTQ